MYCSLGHGQWKPLIFRRTLAIIVQNPTCYLAHFLSLVAKLSVPTPDSPLIPLPKLAVCTAPQMVIVLYDPPPILIQLTIPEIGKNLH